MACGFFPDQGSNLCPLHWQVDSFFFKTMDKGSNYSISSRKLVIFPFLFFILFIYLFIIFGCIGSSLLCTGVSSCGERGLLFIAVRGLLIAVPSRCGAPARGPQASVAVARRLSSCGARA